tara:strand:- start:19 stop:480 length:462 start_codon:yes stop_codon:yes gene_type:complete
MKKILAKLLTIPIALQFGCSEADNSVGIKGLNWVFNNVPIGDIRTTRGNYSGDIEGKWEEERTINEYGYDVVRYTRELKDGCENDQSMYWLTQDDRRYFIAFQGCPGSRTIINEFYKDGEEELKGLDARDDGIDFMDEALPTFGINPSTGLPF